MPKYGVKNFLHIANEYVNPETNTLDGMERWLIGWYCFKFNTTPSDDGLQELTLEELLVLYNMYQIRENPDYMQQQLDPEDPDGMEAFLKEQMGEDYLTEEQMVEGMQQEEELYQKKIEKKMAEDLPNKITTDFGQFSEE